MKIKEAFPGLIEKVLNVDIIDIIRARTATRQYAESLLQDDPHGTYGQQMEETAKRLETLVDTWTS
jgi:hypothetical protein